MGIIVIMTCNDVLSIKGLGKINAGSKCVARSRFEELHEAGRTLIKNWANRSIMHIDRRNIDPFEPFIFGWIAFNGWASCVTEAETDTPCLEAVLQDDQLAKEFDTALLDGDFKAAMCNFRSTWPIFRATINSFVSAEGLSRSEVVELRRQQKNGRYKPACVFRHLASGEEIPLDWPHTISAIYQVRCNLFHGDKGLHCENDVEIVSKAYRALAMLLPILIHDSPHS